MDYLVPFGFTHDNTLLLVCVAEHITPSRVFRAGDVFVWLTDDYEPCFVDTTNASTPPASIASSTTPVRQRTTAPPALRPNGRGWACNALPRGAGTCLSMGACPGDELSVEKGRACY